MIDRSTQDRAAGSNMEEPPEAWTTGDEPMTGAQRSYLKTLSEEAKVSFDENLTGAEASRRIDELQGVTGRGAAPQGVAAQTQEDRITESGEAEADAQGGNTRGVADR